MKRISPLILLSFLLLGCADEEIALTSAAREVFVINCLETASQPQELVLYCADAGQILTEISWDSWGQESARGLGRSLTNTCQPSCAEGDSVAVAVEITLSGLVESESRLFYSKASMVYSEPVNGVLEEIFDLPTTGF